MRIVGYMAASVDGYIADRDGGVGWLDAMNGVEAGYSGFIAGIGTVIMGRRTYDQVLGFGPYPYAAQRTIVVSRTALAPGAPAGVERWNDGVPALVARLRATEDERAAWVVGGAALQAAFLDAGAIDELDLFVVPVLLGDGVRMFPPGMSGRPLDLRTTEALGKGMVRLSYTTRG